MRHNLRYLAALTAFTLAAACGGDPTGIDDSPVVGLFTLTTIAGAPLPYTVQQSSGYRLEITGGHIDLRADRTFTISFSLRESNATDVVESDQAGPGTYTRAGNVITFTVTQTQETFSGRLDGSTLTIREGGISIVYEK